MKGMIFCICLIGFLLSFGMLQEASAASKPNVTRHDAKFLENSVNMHIEWQSPNPVTVVRVSMPGVAKEITVDPYDNRRNPDGYSGEVDVNLNIGGLTGQSFNYVVQLQDELRIKSEPVTGQIKLPFVQQPGVMVPVAVSPGIVTSFPPSGQIQPAPDGGHGGSGGLPGQTAPWAASTTQQPEAGGAAMPSGVTAPQSQMPGAQPGMESDGGLGR